MAPSRYGWGGVTVGWADGPRPCGPSAGLPMAMAANARTRTSPAMTARSLRFIEASRVGRDVRSRRVVAACGRRSMPRPRTGRPAGSGGARRGEDERGEREADEEDQQHDRELPQPALDAAAAAVD